MSDITPPPPGYGAPQPMYGAAPTHPRAVVVLVLGILGLLACMPLGIVAWVLGNGALKEIDANPAAYSGRGMVLAGKVLGIISVVLTVLAFLLVALVFAFGSVVQSSFEQTCSSTTSSFSC